MQDSIPSGSIDTCVSLGEFLTHILSETEHQASHYFVSKEVCCFPQIRSKYQKSINANFLTIKYISNPILEHNWAS